MLIGLITGRFKWWIIGASYFAVAFASGWAVHKLHQANQKEKLKLALEKFEKDNAHANQAEIVVNRLPDGVSSQRLFMDWSRAEK
jgi:hypothetical protein